MTRPSLHHCTNISESLRVVGRPEAFLPQFHEGIMGATECQLQSLADKRKARAARANNPAFAAEVDRNEMASIEEIENFMLELGRLGEDADYV